MTLVEDDPRLGFPRQAVQRDPGDRIARIDLPAFVSVRIGPDAVTGGRQDVAVQRPRAEPENEVELVATNRGDVGGGGHGHTLEGGRHAHGTDRSRSPADDEPPVEAPQEVRRMFGGPVFDDQQRHLDALGGDQRFQASLHPRRKRRARVHEAEADRRLHGSKHMSLSNESDSSPLRGQLAPRREIEDEFARRAFRGAMRRDMKRSPSDPAHTSGKRPRRALKFVLVGHRRMIAMIATLAFVAGLLEALFLVMVTRAAFAVANGQDRIGILSGRSLSLPSALLLAVGLISIRMVLAAYAAWESANLSAGTVARIRGSLRAAVLDSSWG